jgi:serine/threonine protein kinase
MTWPTAFTYQKAIQNPSVVLGPAPDWLRKTKPVMNHILRLPEISAGNFACVFQLLNGKQSSHALRCFTREVTDQSRRYALISEHLSNFASPYFVGFEYIEEGIKIEGKWYPIVTMEWVEGESLDAFVEKHLDDPKVLKRLAAEWRALAAALHGAGMAHGDLQHGNVMVDTNGWLKLVDYDGMFIPALSREKSPEDGHYNYRHPKREKEKPYGPNIDNFSNIVIYLSLLALAADKELWSINNTNGEHGEYLILNHGDYEKAAQSSQSCCFDMLKQSPNPEVIRLAGILADCCSMPITKVPYLEDVLQPGFKWPPEDPGHPGTPSRREVPGRKVKCRKCDYANDKGQVYCQNPNGCAEQLDPSMKKCVKCKKDIPTRAKYCIYCRTGHQVFV